ncbi:MAG: WXG100 family type VII secretion target [Kocuria sp.]|uniref:ESAT-6-like protein n=1 Tax=Kocuria salsicia TaxID=664639 RepID=A0ABV3KBX8_9MICC|nr:MULTISPECIES: WXG100 family type VII secretion target [Kocuria]MBS6030434.1 WXG100 family type VII secretion target [Kocuria rhizophila]MDO4257616.1 WXG100 family type VII secretion target [Kocuria sp.]
MAHFVVDSDTIAAKSQQAHGHIERLSAEVNGMTGTLADLEASWTGTASASFQEAFRSWRSAQAQMEQAVAQINQALAAAGTQYAETEAANARMFAG